MGALYKTKLLDDSGTVLAVLENSTGEREHRRFNQAGDIQFSLPATDPKAVFLGIATRFEIWRRDQRITSGTITRRDVSGNPWTAFGLTNETLLSGIQTPGNVEINGTVSLLSDSSDLAHVFEALTYDYKVQTLNRSFDDNHVADQTDAGTISFELEDQIALKKDAENTYPAINPDDPAGRVCVQFSVPDGYELFRLRWQQQVAATNEIVFRYRTSVDGGSVWTAWSAWAGQGDSQETSAAQGYPLTHPAGTDTVQIQFQLLNSDTETVIEGYDDAGEPIVIYGTTPILEAVELVCRQEAALRPVKPHDTDWPSEATVDITDTQLHYHNGLQAMVEIAEKFGYEFYVDDDCRLHLGKQLGVDRSDEIIFRANHNMNIVQLEDSRQGMCNTLTCLGAGDGLDQLRVTVVNDESVRKYGPHPDKQEWKDIETLAELEAKGREVVGTSLADPGERGVPKQTFRIQGVKDDLPAFYLGDTVRIIIPRDGVNTTGRVLEVTRGPSDKGDAVDIMINRTRESAVDRIVQAIERIPAARPSESRKPPAPTNVRATAGYERIVVQWQASVAGGYSRVYRSATKDGTYKIIYQGYDKKHVDEPLEVGETRHYKVSVVVDGVESDVIGPVKATVAPIEPGDVDTTPPAAPEWAAENPITTDTIVTAQNQRLVRVHLAWDPNTENDLKEYIVYRSDDGGATWKAIRTVPRGTERLTDADGLTVGTEYRYRLTAVDTFGNESECSVVKTIVTGQNPTPTIPTTAPTVTPGARLMGVQLPGVASAADQQVLSYYLVECSTCDAVLDPDTNTYSMPAAPSWGGWATAGIADSRVFMHTGLDYSKGYRYRYKAVNNSSNESLWSDPSAGHVPLKQGQQDIAFRSLVTEHFSAVGIDAGVVRTGKLITDVLELNGWVAISLNTLNNPLYSTSTLREGSPGYSWATVVSFQKPRTSASYYADRLRYSFGFRRKNLFGGTVQFRVKVTDGITTLYSQIHQPNYPNNWANVSGVIDISSMTGVNITVTLQAYDDTYQCNGFSVYTNDTVVNRQVV